MPGSPLTLLPRIPQDSMSSLRFENLGTEPPPRFLCSVIVECAGPAIASDMQQLPQQRRAP